MSRTSRRARQFEERIAPLRRAYTESSSAAARRALLDGLTTLALQFDARQSDGNGKLCYQGFEDYLETLELHPSKYAAIQRMAHGADYNSVRAHVTRHGSIAEVARAIPIPAGTLRTILARLHQTGALTDGERAARFAVWLYGSGYRSKPAIKNL